MHYQCDPHIPYTLHDLVRRYSTSHFMAIHVIQYQTPSPSCLHSGFGKLTGISPHSPICRVLGLKLPGCFFLSVGNPVMSSLILCTHPYITFPPPPRGLQRPRHLPPIKTSISSTIRPTFPVKVYINHHVVPHRRGPP